MTTPRPSASLLLLTPRHRLLLCHRSNHLSFPNAHVFPGGVLSPTDPTPQFCAVRETFEETGLLLTRRPPPTSVDLSAAQRDIHANTLDFSTFLKSFGGDLALETLLPWTTWTTPPGIMKRYKSQFFVGRLPEWVDEDSPVLGDGGMETVSARFLEPANVVSLAMSGGIVLFPPQLFLVTALERCLKIGGMPEVETYSREGFGMRVMEPRAKGKDKDGRLLVDVGEGDVVVVELPKGVKGEPRAVEVIEARREKL